MSSNLECVGLGVDDEADFERLVDAAMASAQVVGEVGGVTVLRYDDLSGARIVFGVSDRSIVDLLPSFAGEPGCRVGELRMLDDEAAALSFVDEDDEVLTVGAVEVEERAWLRAGARPPAPVGAHLVALGVDMTVHADQDSYERSPESLLSEEDASAERPVDLPPDVGWPLGFSAESFVSHGAFDKEDGAYARLSGVVLSAERRAVALTGGAFVHARVRSVMGEVDVCLPDPAGVPPPGAVVAGTAFLVGGLSGWVPGSKAATSSWWERRFGRARRR